MHLLLLAETAQTAESLRALLQHESYAVDTLLTQTELPDYLLGGEYDALVAQVQDVPAFCSALSELRQLGCAVPVLAIGEEGPLEQCVAVLDAGADDFLRRPFATTEGLARLRCVLRRPAAYTPEQLCCGDLRLDCAGHSLQCRDQQCRLNNKEFQLLRLFMRHPDVILSPQQLIQRVWGWDRDAELHVVWTYICNLRRKLRKLRSRVQLCSVRGAGYMLSTEAE